MKAAALLVALLLLQQPGASSTVEGVVVKSGTSDPIAKAVVEIRRAEDRETPAREPQVLITGPDGRFSFREIASGRYTLTVSRTGYTTGQGRELLVEAGRSMKDLRVSLTATGAISGRVYDNSGEPVANVSVQALRYSWSEGEAILTSVKAAETNDRGEFRIFWLPPGRYYLRAIPDAAGPDGVFVHMDGPAGPAFIRRFDGAVIRNNDSLSRRSEAQLAPVFYPGTANPQSAAAVDVGAGADLSGIDFVMVRALTRRVRGIAIDSATGLSVPAASLVLVPRSGSAIGQIFLIPALEGEGFEARDVLPGSYFLVGVARLNGGGRGEAAAPGEVRILGGRTSAEVADKDLDDLRVVLSPGVDIAGRVTVDGGSMPAPTQYGLRHPVIELRDTLKGVPGRSLLYAEFSDDQAFTINDALEGDYRVQVTDLPPGTYVKSIRFGAANAMNGTVHVDSRSREALGIVLGANAGVLEGTVLAGSTNSIAPAPGATVALVPAGVGRDRPDLFLSTRTNGLGHFHMDGIPPGDYLAFAWEEIDEGLWKDPAFIRRSEHLGRSIRINEGTRDAVEFAAVSIP